MRLTSIGSRAERVALLSSAALLTATGFVPQFGGPGYESALMGGIILPAAAAIGAALWLVGRSRQPSAVSDQPFDVLGRGAVLGAIFAVVGVLIATLHGLRTGFCDAPLGYELWATGPGPGAVLGGVWGAAAGLLAGRFKRVRLAAVLLALLGPLGSIAMGIGRFYTSPMVFGFDPFVGYFAGPLYDTVVDPGNRLISYRIGSLASLLAVATTAFHLEVGEESRRCRWVWRGRPGVVAAGVLALGVSLGITLSGPRLGHWHTASSIEEGLGRSVEKGRCRLVYSSGVPKPDAERLARECVGHLPQIEAYLGAKGPEHVTVYLFANDAEKGAYMGASRTYIAKPWRAEIYIQAAGFPHPTLGHELAHVVSGAFGPGPFRVAGPLGGLIPDPGRIEGIAVAAAPSEDDDFTLDEWSKALLDLKLLPEMPSIFRLGFITKQSSTAYTVAGAFISWLHETYGAEAVRNWYSGHAIESVTGGKSLSVLDNDFRAHLAKIQLRPELLAMAKARFDRPSIFGRVCPRRIDRDLALAEARLGAGDIRGAREAYQALLKLEQDNTRARLGLALCDVRDGALDSAIKRYQVLATDPRLSVLERASALEARGDVNVMAEQPKEAIEAYREVAKIDADEDRQRTLEVKTIAALAKPTSGMRLLLIGDPQRGPSWDEAAPALGLEAASGNPLSQYLLGRNLWLHGRPEAALAAIDEALDPTALRPEIVWPPSQRVVREASRLRVLIACSDPKFELAKASDAAKRFLADPGVPAAKREAVERFVGRCVLKP
ncbi:MAG TPA: tetratricopeptide repeat protein [Polyangiaceae bacterium]|nr:tetratricopeptide repeat protein [Polyangiaceae bacterium]